MHASLKVVRDFLTGLIPARSYWELRAAWRPLEAIIGRDDARLHLESGRTLVGVLERLDVLAGCSTSLGIGVGGGRVERWLAPRVTACCGVDISLGMARLARRNANASNMLVVVGSGSDLACFREAIMDLVYSFIVFQHMGDRKVRSYFREAARVLKRGGHFVFQIPVDLECRHRLVPFRERHPYAIRWRTIDDVCRWLEEARLGLPRLFRGDLDEVTIAEARALRAESLIVVARKPAGV